MQVIEVMRKTTEGDWCLDKLNRSHLHLSNDVTSTPIKDFFPLEDDSSSLAFLELHSPRKLESTRVNNITLNRLIVLRGRGAYKGGKS